MIKLDIIAGFLGAGKTTFINKLLAEGYGDRKTVLIENEFGDASIDSSLIETSLEIVELTSGCICCTLQGDFVKGIRRIVSEQDPDQILIEPTGAANLEDILYACEKACQEVDARINSVITIVNAESIQALLEVGGEFFLKQLRLSEYIVMSCVQCLEDEELTACKKVMDSLNLKASICWEDWNNSSVLAIQAEAEIRYSICEVSDTIADGSSHSHCGHSTEYDGSALMSLMFQPMYEYQEDKLYKILSELKKPVYGTVLRGKGFLRAETGMKRIEYIYGSHEKLVDSNYCGTPKYVIIGQRLNADRLAALFEQK